MLSLSQQIQTVVSSTQRKTANLPLLNGQTLPTFSLLSYKWNFLQFSVEDTSLGTSVAAQQAVAFNV